MELRTLRRKAAIKTTRLLLLGAGGIAHNVLQVDVPLNYSMGRRHDAVVNNIAEILHAMHFRVWKGCSLPVHSPWMSYHLALAALGEGKMLERWIVKPDILGWVPVRSKRGKKEGNYSIVIEVSDSSDVKKEAKKLQKIPAHHRLIVTPPNGIEGEIEGIPIVCIDNLHGENAEETWSALLMWKMETLRKAIQRRAKIRTNIDAPLQLRPFEG